MKKQQIIAAICFGIVLIMAISARLQPQDGLLAFEVNGTRAFGNGVTKTDSAGVVRKLMRDHPEVTTLVMQYMPGTQNADANLKIAYDIRRGGLSTHLQSGSFIASGAVDLFLAGESRTMDCGAKIGVHSWAISGPKGGNFNPKSMGSDSRQRIQERFLRAMGIDPAFYAFTRDAAGPDDIYILNPEDIARFGILTEDGCKTLQQREDIKRADEFHKRIANPQLLPQTEP